MPLRLGNNKKERRSYIEKGPTKEQQERRSLIHGRLFGDDSSRSDDSDLNIPAPRRRPPRRTRSESRRPDGSKRGEKKRSRSMTGLIDMRKSLLRKQSGVNHDNTPPPSPQAPKASLDKPEKTTDDIIMTNALKRVQQRRKKKIKERELFMETIMMEDGGGAHYDSDSDEDIDTSEGLFSPGTAAKINIFYRGLQALEQIYLE